MRILSRWSWFIIVLALLVPLDLPAGGSYKKDSAYLNFKKSNLFFASNECFLRSSPSFKGNLIRHIPLGTPLRLVRKWKNIDGQIWFQVETYSLDLIDKNIRGWVNT